MEKRYISAGAGSGKTYTVTTRVAEMVREGRLEPEKVILTTFTNAAAQELREKAKKELINLGLNEEAQSMEHALIGTVHSVAYTFLSKYWYLLGIAPDAAAMEPEEVDRYRDQSLREIFKGKSGDRDFLYRFAETYNITYSFNSDGYGLNYEFWKDDLCKVLDYMQWYNISDDQLTTEATNNMINCLTAMKDDDYHVLASYVAKDVKAAINGLKKKDKNAIAQLMFVSIFPASPTDAEIDRLAEIFEKRKRNISPSDQTRQFQEEYAFRKAVTPEVKQDLVRYASIIFTLAKQWRKDYRAYKDENHIIDFNDMEEMFLQLLENDVVKEDIKDNYTHLFVDEFQDSNPIQVQIFQKLSELLNTCYVGDKKQAIYGFRGSDTELTAAIADSFGENQKETLEHSYRSVEPLVKFANKIFKQVFCQSWKGVIQDLSMPEDDVKLKMTEEKDKGNREKVEKPLCLWRWKDDADLALQIQQYILREKVKPCDVAVLARSNSELDKLADELRKLHVPVCREETDIKDSRTGQLMKALLTLVVEPSNQLARAEVAYLTKQGQDVKHIIEDRLDVIKDDRRTEYLKDLPLLERLYALCHFKSGDDEKFSRNLLAYQSISSLVESFVIELDLYSLVQSWNNHQAEETNLQVFIDLARKYEDNATKNARPATVPGFIAFFTEQKQKGAANDEGVRLFTYHKSKGLEWKTVIMLSLEKDGTEAKDIATKCMLGCQSFRMERPTAANPNPKMMVSVVRNIFGTKDNIQTALADKLCKHPLWKQVRNARIAESARLLYVGVTRARNVLILATKEKSGSPLRWFESVGIKDINLNHPDRDIFKIDLPFDVEEFNSTNLLTWGKAKDRKTHSFGTVYSLLNAVRNLSPSKVGTRAHDINIINKQADRMKVNSAGDDARMGDFIHNVFCCCDDGIDEQGITSLRSMYGFTKKNLSDPKALLDSWKYLTDKLRELYGPSIGRHHEVPFRHLDNEGHIITGFIDLLWETANGIVIVDYKTCPGNHEVVFDPSSDHYVGRHGDQLDCYERAIEAETNKPVIARVIYYPVTRYMVEVKKDLKPS